jgi:hypothetical protein
VKDGDGDILFKFGFCKEQNVEKANGDENPHSVITEDDSVVARTLVGDLWGLRIHFV